MTTDTNSPAQATTVTVDNTVDMAPLSTDNHPTQSPLQASWLKDNILTLITVCLALFLVTMAVLMGSHIGSSKGATLTTGACDSSNMRYEGKVPDVYNGNIKAFQDAEPELARKWLRSTALGCGQYSK